MLIKFLKNKNTDKSIKKESQQIIDRLQEKFNYYNTKNLKGVSPIKFEKEIKSKIGKIDIKSEGFSKKDKKYQRDLSVKFHWGHNHDFGQFQIKGGMGSRHITLLRSFFQLFDIDEGFFQDKYVYDIGCWTGGTSLMLAALGAKVLAIEEVKKYSHMTNYLAKSFNVDSHLKSKPLSIYECNKKGFQNKFDIVYFPGVLYHLTDPVLALRILFNSLKKGGTILVESAGFHSEESVCKFEGSFVHTPYGSKKDVNRGGWNWYIPSQKAMMSMMMEVGFHDVEVKWSHSNTRLYGIGTKKNNDGICRAGLSVPNIN